MATTTAAPGAGDIELVLGTERILLRRTLAAGLWVSRSGGFKAAIDSDDTPMKRLYRNDIDTMAALIRVGTGHGPNAVPDLEQRIFDQGLDEVSEPLRRYILSLQAGANGAQVQAGGGESAKNA
jgi:hypothetical protein